MSENKYLRYLIVALLLVTVLPLGYVPKASASITGYWYSDNYLCLGEDYELRGSNIQFQNTPYELTLKITFGGEEHYSDTQTFSSSNPYPVEFEVEHNIYSLLDEYGVYTAEVFHGSEKVYEDEFSIRTPHIRLNKKEAKPGETIEVSGYYFCYYSFWHRHCPIYIKIDGQLVATLDYTSGYFTEDIVVPDLPPGNYTVTANDPHGTAEASLLVDYFVWDNVVDDHQQPGTFGYLVNDIKTMIGGLGSGGGLEDLQADLTAHRTQVEDIISTIDWTDITALNVILGDDSQFTSNAELNALKGHLEAQLTTMNTDLLTDISDIYTALMSHDVYAQGVMETIDWTDVEGIKGIIEDSSLFTSDAELTALRDELAAQLTAMKDGLSSEISELLAALQEHDSYTQGILDTVDWTDVDYLRETLDDETRFTSDAELAELLGVIDECCTSMEVGMAGISTNLQTHDTEIKNLLNSMKTEDLQDIKDRLDDGARFTSDTEMAELREQLTQIESELMDGLELLYLRSLEVGVQIESCAPKSHYILSTLNGEPRDSQITLTLGTTPLDEGGDYTLTRMGEGLYVVELSNRAGNNKSPIVVEVEITDGGLTYHGSTIYIFHRYDD